MNHFSFSCALSAVKMACKNKCFTAEFLEMYPCSSESDQESDQSEINDNVENPDYEGSSSESDFY